MGVFDGGGSMIYDETEIISLHTEGKFAQCIMI